MGGGGVEAKVMPRARDQILFCRGNGGTKRKCRLITNRLRWLKFARVCRAPTAPTLRWEQCKGARAGDGAYWCHSSDAPALKDGERDGNAATGQSRERSSAGLAQSCHPHQEGSRLCCLPTPSSAIKTHHKEPSRQILAPFLKRNTEFNNNNKKCHSGCYPGKKQSWGIKINDFFF